MTPRPLAFLISFALLPVFLLAGSQFPTVQAQSTDLILPKQVFGRVLPKPSGGLVPFITAENLLFPAPSNTYFDDFSNYPSGSAPSGWTQYGTSSVVPAVVDFGGTGTTFHRLEFPAYIAQSTSKWLIKDDFTGSNVTVSAKVNFQTNSDGGGIVLAWIDSNNFIAILPNPFWDEIVVWEYANGQIRSTFGTGRSAVPIQANQDYWLKVTTKVSQTGDRQIDVWWSTDGSNYTVKLSATDLANLTGQMGVGTYQFLSDTLFDDFSITVDTPQIKAWTLLYYVAGDDDQLDQAYRLLVDSLKSAAGQVNYNIAVMFDGKAQGDSRYYAISDNISFISKGELNTGDPNTLINFVDWARETLPSQHTALIISDHGNLDGVAHDSSNSDLLEMKDLSTAFTKITAEHGKIDILYMDACDMATIEVAYQVQQFFDYYISSENEAWAPSTPHTPKYLEAITADLSPELLAREIAINYRDVTNSLPNTYTISVVRLAQLPKLVLQLKTLSYWLRIRMTSYGSTVRDRILSQVQYFDSDNKGGIDASNDELIDLYDFARLIKDNISDQDVKDAAQLVMNTIQDDVDPENRYIVPDSEFHNSNGPQNDPYVGKLNHSHGVAIYFPRLGFWRSWYQGNSLDFAAGTDWSRNASTNLSKFATDTNEWGPMLVEYVKVTNPNAPDDSNPPELIPPLILPRLFFLPLLIQSNKSIIAPPPPTQTPVNPSIPVPPTATDTPIPPTVTPIPPTPTFTPIPNTSPMANNQNVTTAQNVAKSITLAASDANNDSLTYIIVSNPSHGTLSGATPNLTYTPSTGFSGVDSFTFKANDGKADSNIATVSLTITPSQPPITVQFSSSTFSVNESAGTATITIILSSASGQVVTVNYAASDGTATAGSDYIATSGTLTFNPGETSKTFTVPIIDDNVYELNETINIGLSSPSNATLGTHASTMLTIVNDDGLPLVSVQANQDWQDTGIPVQAGDLIQVNYLSGTWTIWKGVDRYTDANGQVGRTETCTLLPSANISGLVGRVSTGTVQFLGNSGSFSAQNSGALQLSMNDCVGKFADNDGAISIQVTVTP